MKYSRPIYKLYNPSLSFLEAVGNKHGLVSEIHCQIIVMGTVGRDCTVGAKPGGHGSVPSRQIQRLFSVFNIVIEDLGSISM